MALSVRSGSVASAAGASGTTFALTLPTGATTGDWWVVWFKLPDATTISKSGGATFTQHPSGRQQAASPTHGTDCWYRIIDGTEGSTEDFTFSANRQICHVTLLVQDAAATLDATAGGIDSANATSHTLPSILTDEGGLILAGYGQEAASHTWTADSDYTQVAEVFNATSTNSLEVASRTGAAATTYNADVATTDVEGRQATLILAFAAGGAPSTTADAGHSAGTGTAYAPSVALSPNAGHAVATGAAHGPSAAITANAGHASATGAAPGPSVAVVANAGHASATGEAHDATVSTGADTTADAGHASATAAASQPSVAIAPNAGHAAATGAAHAPSVSIVAAAGHASATATAHQPAAAVTATAGHASASGTAHQPSGSVQAAAGHAAATGTAYGVVAALLANAGHASGTGAAYDATATGESAAIEGFGTPPRLMVSTVSPSLTATTSAPRITAATPRPAGTAETP